MGVEPNHKLAELMREAGLSNKGLARRIREMSAHFGKPVASDHTSISRWLNGMQPRAATASCVAEVLAIELGRAVTISDIGMPGRDTTSTGLDADYAEDPRESVNTLARLWRSDLGGHSAVHQSAVNSAAWAKVSLDWLVRGQQDKLIEGPTSVRVGGSDIEALRATTRAFGMLDNDFGGGHARRALIQYLSSDVAGLLAGRYTDGVGRQLFSAAAEATLLAAWMSYDAGIHGLAQRYFIQALRLAQASDDALLAGNVLDAMSHQATFLGYSREAATMARAARAGTGGRATPSVTAHFHAMEARALASAGDSIGANSALSEAVRVFERRQSGDDPDWIRYFDNAELSAEFSHCFRDLGRADDAVKYALQARSGASSRSDFFVMMVLAVGHLGSGGRGDVDEACQVARRALEAGGRIKSARCAHYVQDFRQRLEPLANASPVIELTEYAADNPLWQASSALL